MTYESVSSAERFATVQVLVDLDGRPVTVIGKMPKPEFYTDEACRLASAALFSQPTEELGFVDTLGTSVSSREKIFRIDPLTFQLGEFREAALEPDSLPLQIRFMTLSPITQKVPGYEVRPTEIKMYLPLTGEMRVVRLNDLDPSEVDNRPELEKIIAVDQATAPIQPTEKDWFFFYACLLMAAGEKLPK